MAYLSLGVLTIGVLALAYVRRSHRAEAATLLIVAIPIVLSASFNAPHAYRAFREAHGLDTDEALASAAPVIAEHRNLALARVALSSIESDETYAVIAPERLRARTAEARRERARVTYVVSWLQYWLAPRAQVDPASAEWLIMLDASDPPHDARSTWRVGHDLLVHRR